MICQLYGQKSRLVVNFEIVCKADLLSCHVNWLLEHVQ